jgi:hypothetical protein
MYDVCELLPDYKIQWTSVGKFLVYITRPIGFGCRVFFKIEMEDPLVSTLMNISKLE